MKENKNKPKKPTMLKANEHISHKTKSERTNQNFLINENLGLNNDAKNTGLNYVRNEKSDKKHVFNILNEKDTILRSSLYELEIEKNKLPNNIYDLSKINNKIQEDIESCTFNIKVYDSLLCLFSIIVIVMAYLDVSSF